MSTVTTLSLFLVALLSLFAPSVSSASENGVPYQNEWLESHYQHRLALFSTQPLNPGDIVFVGDSLTELGANWAVRFENVKVRNRGIRGDTTYGVLARLDELKQRNPSAIFLLIGINDIFNIVYENQIEKLSDTAKNIHNIAKQLKSSLPNTKIYVLSLLPDHRDFISVLAKEVNKQLSDQSDAYFTFINLHDLFAVDGMMNPKLTTDGTHLNESGYQVWRNAIMPYLDDLK